MRRKSLKEISHVYNAVLELPESERAAFLESCEDEDLRQEVLSLLRNEEKAKSFLEEHALEVASRLKTKAQPSLLGRRLGSFNLISVLGKGGMGEVYRAKDRKLGRDVAIKVLSEEFTQDNMSIARFQREAKLLASLNHPNISSIHGLEESDGIHFLVLELVEGDTLADRIKSGPIPVEESLKLALQITEALEAAHEKGVIHRDLKPANIKIAPDGNVKILDFGLAKVHAADSPDTNLSDSPTESDDASQQGIILGTAAYMSPEQARGKPVDKRTDIWAFGCVLYEMLTGCAAFSGEDVTEILAALIRVEPDWSSLPAKLHWRLKEVLERCLVKEAKDRFHDIADVRLDIQRVLADPRGVFAQPVTADEDRKKLRIGLPGVAAVFIAGLIIAGVSVWMLKPTPEQEDISFKHLLPEGQQFNNTIATPPEYAVAVSRDGTKIAYSTKKGLYVCSLDDPDARPIPGADEDTLRPFFSPDGQSIGYFNKPDMKWKVISIGGGTPSPLVNKGIRGFTPSWDSQDAFLYTDLDKGIMRVSAFGGSPELLVEGSAKNYSDPFPFSPQLLPNGENLLYTYGRYRDPDSKERIIVRLESGERRDLFPGTDARYLPTGHIVYLLRNNLTYDLWAIPFDLDKLKVTGDPKFMLEGVESYSVSASGTLVYVPESTAIAEAAGAPASGYTLVWVDGQGKEEPLGFAAQEYGSLRFSPDGTQVATSYPTDDTASDIFILDLNTENPMRLTSKGGMYPIWTLPDGEGIVYYSDREVDKGIYLKAANGKGEEKLLTPGTGRFLLPSSFSVDGSALAMVSMDNPAIRPNNGDIEMLSMEDRTRTSLVAGKYDEYGPKISPDGQWMVYVSSNKWGGTEVRVKPFSDSSGGTYKISTDGGNNPLWSPDGSRIFYRNGDEIMVAEVKTEPTFEHQPPEVLSSGFQSNVYTKWAIHPSEEKFLMLKSLSTNTSLPRSEIVVNTNWFEELKEKAPVD